MAGRSLAPHLSISLDLTRLTLALVVVVGHVSQPYFQEGWPDLSKVAIAAVGGFFVLSGYTIRFLTAHAGVFEPRRYLIERLSRLWSVVIPALVLTLVSDLIAHKLATRWYMHNWGPYTSAPVFRFGSNLLFLSQVWGLDVSPFSNSPFWSMSYEAGFYALYAVWHGTHPRWRLATCALGVALLGPHLALMAVFWVAGVLVYELHDRLSPGTAIRLTFAVGVVMLGAALLLALNRPACLWLWSALGLAIRTYFGWFRLDSARVTRTLLAGCMAFCGVVFCIIGVANALDRARPTQGRGWVAAARSLGELTFPLYLFHFPLLVLCGAIGFYDRGSVLGRLLLAAVVIVIIAALTPATQRFKFALRRWLGPQSRRKSLEGRPGSM